MGPSRSSASDDAARLNDVLDAVLSAGLAEESATAYAGLSDASAVPESASVRGAGWEPAIVVNYPVEPSQVEPADEFGDELAGTDEPGAPDAPTAVRDREDEAEALEEESLEEEQEPGTGAESPEQAVESDPAATRTGDVVTAGDGRGRSRWARSRWAR